MVGRVHPRISLPMTLRLVGVEVKVLNYKILGGPGSNFHCVMKLARVTLGHSLSHNLTCLMGNYYEDMTNNKNGIKYSNTGSLEKEWDKKGLSK